MFFFHCYCLMRCIVFLFICLWLFNIVIQYYFFLFFCRPVLIQVRRQKFFKFKQSILKSEKIYIIVAGQFIIGFCCFHKKHIVSKSAKYASDIFHGAAHIYWCLQFVLQIKLHWCTKYIYVWAHIYAYVTNRMPCVFPLTCNLLLDYQFAAFNHKCIY